MTELSLRLRQLLPKNKNIMNKDVDLNELLTEQIRPWIQAPENATSLIEILSNLRKVLVLGAENIPQY
jgi:hypothetical protein